MSHNGLDETRSPWTKIKPPHSREGQGRSPRERLLFEKSDLLLSEKGECPTRSFQGEKSEDNDGKVGEGDNDGGGGL